MTDQKPEQQVTWKQNYEAERRKHQLTEAELDEARSDLIQANDCVARLSAQAIDLLKRAEQAEAALAAAQQEIERLKLEKQQKQLVIDGYRADLQRVEAELGTANEAWKAEANANSYLGDENTRLREALRKYGRHLPQCGYLTCTGCTCGLSAAIEGGKE